MLLDHTFTRDTTEGRLLLTEPEMLACLMLFSSNLPSPSLPTVCCKLAECLSLEGSNAAVVACNVAAVDRLQLIETAVISFRVSSVQ